jgi:hypothetical protein
MGRALHRQDENFPKCLQTQITIRRRPRAFVECRQPEKNLCLRHQIPRPSRLCNSHRHYFTRVCTLFLTGVRFFNEAVPCNKSPQNPPQNKRGTIAVGCRKRPRSQCSAFDAKTVTATASFNSRCVRQEQSKQKSPKDAAGSIQMRNDTKWCEVVLAMHIFYPSKSRLRVQLDQHNKCVTTPKGAKSSPRRKVLSIQKLPKGAARFTKQAYRKKAKSPPIQKIIPYHQSPNVAVRSI